MARAGSALWLIRHELRMFMLNSLVGRSKDGKRTLTRRNVVTFTLLALLMHGAAYLVLPELPSLANPSSSIIAAVSISMFALMAMMLSSGLKASVETLFERADLDLLLSSPLPSRSIFTARLAGMTGGICAIYLFFLAPLAHAGLLLGQLRWLAVYPVVLSMGVIAACVSMLLTLALVRVLGVRRTRTVAQILGALSGAVIFLFSQVQNTALRPATVALFARLPALAPDSLVFLPARAALGAPAAVALFGLAGPLLFALTAHLTHGYFARGLQLAAGSARVSRAPAGALRFHFRRSLVLTVLIKEWRLIARDPQLISQVLLQLLYVVPMFVPLLANANPSLPGISAALVFLSASLTSSLGWIVMAAEEAPDLLHAAPCKAVTVAHAKLLAVILPSLLLVLPALAWIGRREPASAAVMAAMLVCATLSAALVVKWCGRPALRSDFRQRGRGNLIGMLFEFTTGLCWSGASFLTMSALTQPQLSLLYLLGGVSAAAFAVALVAGASLWRPARR